MTYQNCTLSIFCKQTNSSKRKIAFILVNYIVLKKKVVNHKQMKVIYLI